MAGNFAGGAAAARGGHGGIGRGAGTGDPGGMRRGRGGPVRPAGGIHGKQSGFLLRRGSEPELSHSAGDQRDFAGGGPVICLCFPCGVCAISDDRALLRAIHFFEETSRVEQAADAIRNKKYDDVLRLMDESGNSSWELLQNCYSMQDCHEQKITRTLALTKLFLKKINDGMCRVHGGGFAGVIAAIVPEAETENYVNYIAQYVGKENVYPMDIRAIGAAHIG